jgi:hypothetical protein
MEITILGGARYRVEGTTEEVERTILNADRGSIMNKLEKLQDIQRLRNDIEIAFYWSRPLRRHT